METAVVRLGTPGEDGCFIIDHPEHGKCRAKILDGEIVICGIDACELFLIKNHKDALRKLDRQGVVLTDLLTAGGMQKALFVTEGGLNELSMNSRKPEAIARKRWICYEVLPSLRKTGTYTVPQVKANALVPKSFAEALELAARLEREREQLAKENSHLSHLRLIEAPKVEACDHFLDTEGMVNIDTLSKILHDRHYIDIGPVKLFRFLREHKVIKYTVVWAGQHPLDINVPMQDYVDRGWLDLKHSSKKKIHGFEVSLPVTYVTPKGEIGIRNMLLSHGYAPSNLPKPAA